MARHRAVDAAPVAPRPDGQPHRRRRRGRAVRRCGRSSGRWRCGGPCGSSPGTCSRPSLAAPDAGSPTPSDDGSPRKLSGRRRARTATGSATRCDQIVEYLDRPRGVHAAAPRRAPDLGGTFTAAPGTKWSADVALMTRLLTILMADGLVVRGRNAGALAHLPADVDVDGQLARRAHGAARPGAGLRPARRAAAVDVRAGDRGRPHLVARVDEGRGPRPRSPTIDAMPVALDDGSTGWVLPTTPPTSPRRPRSSRGWRCCRRSTRPRWAGASGASTSTRRTRRTCSTRPATPAPPCGSTGGSSGAGCRTSDERVRLVLLEEVSPDARRRLDVEADRLDAFLGGEHITNVFASPQVRHERLR